MGRIVYSVAGEGRGHAARAIALVEVLRRRHRIALHAAGQALDLLGCVYADTEVEVRPLTCMEFHYGADRRLDYITSFFENLPFLAALPEQVRRVELELTRFEPDLVISDFEPLAPRAAVAQGVPFVTVDHQSFLVSEDLTDLPGPLRRYAAFMRPFVRAFYPEGRELGLISSFHHAPLRPTHQNVAQIGVLLRPEIRNAKVETHDHLVAYIRRGNAAGVLKALARLEVPVDVFGLGAREAEGWLRFRAIDSHGFVTALATSVGLVTTAGNQLIGEAIHLGKPIFAMPEPGNLEQHLNAHFIARSGAGMVGDAERVTVRTLERFIERLPQLSNAHLRRDGTAEAAAHIELLMDRATRRAGRNGQSPCEEPYPWRGASSAIAEAAAI